MAPRDIDLQLTAAFTERARELLAAPGVEKEGSHAHAAVHDLVGAFHGLFIPVVRSIR